MKNESGETERVRQRPHHLPPLTRRVTVRDSGKCALSETLTFRLLLELPFKNEWMSSIPSFCKAERGHNIVDV